MLKLGSIVVFAIITAIKSENDFQWAVYGILLGFLVILTFYEIDLVNTLWLSITVILVFLLMVTVGIFFILF